VQSDQHVLAVCRHVEGGGLSAGLVRKAEQWPWSSLWARSHDAGEIKALLAPWPVRRPADWAGLVNEPLPARELEQLETSLVRARPFGDANWTAQTAERLRLQHTMRPVGRPAKRQKPTRQQAGR
jgi:putative transposase